MSELELELEGEFRFSYDWMRAAVSHSLHHINLFGDGKRHGFATILFLVSAIISFQYAYVEYLDTQSAYLMAINRQDELSVPLTCSALSCEFFQEERCVESRLLHDGENTTVAAADCQWTVKLITDSRFESKRTALGLLSGSQNESSVEYFAAVEQETLKFISLSKTVDETYEPAFESWSAQVFSSYDYFSDCAEYHDSTDRTCGAFQLSFDNKVYTITVNDQVGFIIILSTGALSTLVFGVLWRIILCNLDAASELHLWLSPKED